VFALVLRLIFFWESAHQIGIVQLAECCPDAINYIKMATAILDGTDAAERYFFTFGPGYAYFLASLMIIFGRGYLALLLVNILISTVSCLVVYKLAKDITNSYPVAVVSGIIVATSYTSITLSNMLLSDTVFQLLFAVGLLIFVRSHRTQRWSHFVLAGGIFGVAALVRALAQFWPLTMFIMSCALLRFSGNRHVLRRSSKWRAVVKPATCVGISILVIGAWVLRNYTVHGIPTMTMSGIIGVSKVAAAAENEERPFNQVREEWVREYLERTGQTRLTAAELYRLLEERAFTALKNNPSGMWRVYRSWTWQNLTAISRYHRGLLPDFKRTLIRLEYIITDNKLNYLCLSLSVLGFLILLWERRWSAASILGLTYLYFVPLVGLNPYQGSRVFFPAQIAWAILIAVVLVSAGRLVGRLLDRNRA